MSTQQQQLILRRSPTKVSDARDGDFVEVALDVPVFTSWTYRVPEDLVDAVKPGVRLLVPFRGRPRTGIALRRTGPPQDEELLQKIVSVVDALDVDPIVSPQLLELMEWTAKYYFAPIGEVLRMAIPSGLRVAGERMLDLTEAGRVALMTGVVHDPLHKQFLGLLAERGEPLKIDAIKRELPKLTFRAIATCERVKWVASAWLAGSEGVKKKIETFVKLRRDPYVDERLGTRQASLIATLQIEAIGVEWSWTELRELVDVPVSVLRRLEDKSLVSLEEREVFRDPFMGDPTREPETFELTPDQAAALGEIRARMSLGTFYTFLLHGVTGSGKTEVYVRVIRDTIAAGKRALILLPEISLTPQFVGIFRSHFGEEVAVLHSALTKGERYDQWRRIRDGMVKIVIGARSALFAPLSDVGVIIVDEEHDNSFKQERGCRYHARDMAQVWGRKYDAIVILGTATPSVDTYFNARQQKIGYLPMATRVAERLLPEVEIVDMREPGAISTEKVEGVDEADPTLSVPLRKAIAATLEAGEQTILFLNRRGHSPFVMCRDCGASWRCPHCSVSLTYHRRKRALRCHYCDHQIVLPTNCYQCKSEDIGLLGTGTEKLEVTLREMYPTASIARLDRDTGKRLNEVIRRFRRHEIDILLGTQMVTKGHDFPGVTLVGVIMADLGLNFPDFRAGEKTFQVLTQVAGRAGRGERAGRVIVQTYSPWHYAIEAARQHSYSEFVTHELHTRREMLYPPFASLACVLFEGEDERATERAARLYANAGKRIFANKPTYADEVSLLGPAQAPLARLRGKSRWQLLVKGRSRGPMRNFLGELLTEISYFDATDLHPGVSVVVDVDPQTMM